MQTDGRDVSSKNRREQRMKEKVSRFSSISVVCHKEKEMFRNLRIFGRVVRRKRSICFCLIESGETFPVCGRREIQFSFGREK